jgi:hypothetical protein
MAPPHDIVKTVRAELATPGLYHLHPTATAQPSPFWIALQWLYERYIAFEHALAAKLKLGAGARDLLGDALVLLCVLVVGIALARLLASLQGEYGARGAPSPLARSRSAHAIVIAAGDAAASEDYARAVRLLFTAAVVLLDMRGVLSDEESATINELRRAFHRRGRGDEAAFEEIARLYTDAAYAESLLDARAWTRAHDAYQSLSRSLSA